MSTNFYTMGNQGNDNPDFHIGKRIGIEGGKIAFVWAMNQDRLNEAQKIYGNPCPTCGRRINDGVVDEYGQTYTWPEFFEILAKCDKELSRSVGVSFC